MRCGSPTGAMPLFWPRPSAQVSFESATATWTTAVPGALHLLHCQGDPYIRVSYDGSSSTRLVESTMRLARRGGGALVRRARRGRPLPHRTQGGAQPGGAGRLHVGDAVTRCCAPAERPSLAQWRRLAALVGSDDLSADPAPHFLMGVPMYAKATSPLRRYADLLLHWQVHAALRAAAGPDNPLPAPALRAPLARPRLAADVLPLLRLRERSMRALDSRDGAAQWILQAFVRAWRYGEAALPPTFRLAVADAPGPGRAAHVRGPARLVRPPRRARRRRPRAAGVALADVAEGDVFEVELADVNVYSQQITVRALRRVERGGWSEHVYGGHEVNT